MPIGVPLIICGSIALVGSGYAFKKLVYDQHLAHYVEAFIANHLPSSEPRLAAPVSSRSDHEERSAGSTSAWTKGVNPLRRRKASQEDQEPLISLDERSTSNNSHEIPSVPSPTILPTLTHDQENTDTETVVQHYDLSGPNSQDDEIKSSIFNIPTSTYQSNNRIEETQLQPSAHEAGPSGTFSFLSLSQVSSPEAPATMLDSMTFSHLGSGSDWAVSSSGPMRSENEDRRSENGEDGRDRRDEVISMPDTGYSTEAFSNLSSPESGYRSPLSQDGIQTRGPDSTEAGGRREGGGGLGLAVEDLGMSFVPLRRQASVVSISESEGGSDWEKISVARST